MALPKKKLSRARVHKRRAQKKINVLKLIVCKQCNKKIRPHQVCSFCGYYKGRDVLGLVEKKAKKDKKRKEREKN